MHKNIRHTIEVYIYHDKQLMKTKFVKRVIYRNKRGEERAMYAYNYHKVHTDQKGDKWMEVHTGSVKVISGADFLKAISTAKNAAELRQMLADSKTADATLT